MRRNFGNPRPSKKAVHANLAFLNLGNQDDFISQCNNCVHALNGRYDFKRDWCHEFELAPTGVCLEKEPVK